jgi:hypothetical protein
MQRGTAQLPEMRKQANTECLNFERTCIAPYSTKAASVVNPSSMTEIRFVLLGLSLFLREQGRGSVLFTGARRREVVDCDDCCRK